jgi:mannose-6-phosphate isomerase-like protein (cupin superfamily)
MIYRFKPETEFEIEERSFIIEMLGSGADPSCSIARARVKPGITTALHALRDTVERYIILQGEGEVSIGTRPVESVSAMDVVWIDKNEKQKIRNVSKVDDLVFLCVCTPGFRMDAYIGMEMDMEK